MNFKTRILIKFSVTLVKKNRFMLCTIKPLFIT